MSKEYTRTISIFGSIPLAGRIIFFDDLEGLLLWTKYQGVGDAIFELDPAVAKLGSQSLHIKTRTTDTQAGDSIGPEILLHSPPSQIISLTTSFQCPDYTKINAIRFTFNYYDGINTHDAHVIFYPNVPKWELYNADTGFTLIPELSHKLYTDTWHLVSLKVNFSTDFYFSLQVDHIIADLSAYPIWTDPNTSDIRLLNRISIENIGANPSELYLDQIIIHEL